MRTILILTLFFGAVLIGAGTGRADEFRDKDLGRVQPNAPIQFRTATGGVFYPRRVIISTADGPLAAALPGAGYTARSEDRIDLSGLPVLGRIFRPTQTTAGASQYDRLGPLYRDGRALYLDAADWPGGLAGAPVALVTNVPRTGAVSFDLGRLPFEPAAAVPGNPELVGYGYLVGDTVVLASTGGEPAWPSVEALIRGLF